MNDAVPVWPLRYGVVGKALADGVGWVKGGGLLPLWSRVGGRGGRFSVLDFFVSERSSGSDEFGAVFAFILLCFGHSLFGHLVRVIGGTYCDFVLNRSQGGQMGDSRARFVLVDTLKASLRIVFAIVGQIKV